MLMNIKKVIATLGVIVTSVNLICNVRAMRVNKVRYDAVRMCAIVDRLRAQEGFDANEIIAVLYRLDYECLSPGELITVREWKRRLHQHAVEERLHFDGDEDMQPTGARFSRAKSTSADIRLSDFIGIVAAGGHFHWSRRGRAIMADSNATIEENGDAVSVRKLSGRGVTVEERPNRGLHAVFKFTTAGGGFTSDIGAVYLK